MIAIAVDDEVLMLGALVEAIKASPDITEVIKFSGCDDALEFVKNNPVDIDKLLIVTFTNAAAAEMRERIFAAINRELLNRPESEHLQRQAALIHNAKITTIHSFCLEVIRNYFSEIGLDPSVRIADDGEIKLINDIH